jgi:four helix bundle protein
MAEGSSGTSQNERHRYFEIARGSVIEIDAAIKIAFKIGYAREEENTSVGRFDNKNF